MLAVSLDSTPAAIILGACAVKNFSSGRRNVFGAERDLWFFCFLLPIA
jgi:hypothetical protein